MRLAIMNTTNPNSRLSGIVFPLRVACIAGSLLPEGVIPFCSSAVCANRATIQRKILPHLCGSTESIMDSFYQPQHRKKSIKANQHHHAASEVQTLRATSRQTGFLGLGPMAAA